MTRLGELLSARQTSSEQGAIAFDVHRMIVYLA